MAQPTSTRPWFWPLIELRQSAIERALARQPNPSGEEIERAAQQLAWLVSAAQRDRELASQGLLGWRLALVGILLLIAGSATLGLLSAFFARGGAIFRLLGIAVVGQSGREVSRFHACTRALIAWAPGIAALLLLLASSSLRSIENLSVAQLSPSLVLLGVFVAGATVAFFHVPHGLQDRIARTSLVAR
jgi:hypothetical protein